VRVAAPAKAIAYHHLLLPRHAILDAEGVACESFYPGLWALRALAAEDRTRLFQAAPVLASVLGGARPEDVYGPRVRPLLDGAAVRRLFAERARPIPRPLQPQTALTAG
jgi:hypothetical protein